MRWLVLAVAFAALIFWPFHAGAPGASKGVLAATFDISSTGVSSSAEISVPDNIRSLVTGSELRTLRWPNFSYFKSAVNALYAPGYQALWLAADQPIGPARALIAILERAEEKGLQPDDYEGPKWQARLQNLSAGGTLAQAEFDVALTISALRYATDLHSGRVDPSRLGFGIPTHPFNAAEFVRNRLLTSGDIKTELDRIEPQFARYKQTLKALALYNEIAKMPEEAPLPQVPDKGLAPGQTYTGAQQLARRLVEFGDLPPQATLPQQPDLYAGELVSAVKNFQRRNDFNADGKLTKETVRELNVPAAQRLKQLQYALERWRWLPDNIKPPMVEVNLPEFRLRAYEHDELSVTMKVVVGKAAGHHTPVFTDEMEYVIFRPFWNVPTSIIRNEIIPALRRNPDYIEHHNMQVTGSNGQIVSEGAVSGDTLSGLRSGRYDIRQRPGPKNSLGLVKFDFPNSYDVYMHGTPQNELFSRTRRDFSHGCIRVEDPTALAEWVLGLELPGVWPLERIKEAMYGDRTQRVNLPHRIPVLIMYQTAMATETGEVQFFQDIYKLDAELERALAGPHR
ncbi:MAG TPA: L,D-transpeptidase family protein [Candidatus Limnocylindrales bacterium]|nr:L,D-transpeptidase family protein [Candidatus Limnocylindrales bacterium]